MQGQQVHPTNPFDYLGYPYLFSPALISNLHLPTGSISDDEVAIVGKDEWLYLYKGSNKYYDAYSDNLAVSCRLASSWAKAIRTYHSYAATCGAKFASVVIPNKASILATCYPLSLPSSPTPLLRNLIAELGDLVICPVEQLNRMNAKYSTYRKLDTHLTEYGNLFFSDLILRSLGISTSLALIPSKLVTIENSGDLGCRYSGIARELVTRIKFQHANDFLFTEVQKPIGKHTGLIYETVNYEAPIQGRLAVFGNSFFDRPNGWSMAPLFCRIFKTVRFHWQAGIDYCIAESFRPDFILFQTCERFLSRPPVDLTYISDSTITSRKSVAMTADSGHALGHIQAPTISSRQATVDRFSIITALDHGGELFTGAHSLGQIRPNEELPLNYLCHHVSHLRKHGLVVVNKDLGYIRRINIQSFLDAYFSDDQVCAKLQAAISPGKWHLYSLMPSGNGGILARFGIILPINLINHDFVIKCEGREPLQANMYYDSNLGHTHWFMPIECVMGVECEFPVPLKSESDYLHFDFSFLDPDFSEYSLSYRRLAAYTNPALLDNVPDIQRIQRVASKNANHNSFLNGGRSAFLSLKLIAENCGISFNTNSLKVLDWGVGCGRVSKHFTDIENVKLTGIDIDSDNIQWCNSHLIGSYLTVDLTPPTCFDDNSFHLIYSCSVLSHLTEDNAMLWLSEMHRVLAMDGVALLSFNGISNSAAYLSRRPREFLDVINGNLFDKDANTELKGFIPSDNYYRATFASDQWWLEMFGRFFTVLKIEHSVLSGFQHIAVLGKKLGDHHG